MTIQDILDAISEVEQTSIGRGLELRMSFSKLVNQQLKKKGWTQKRLAEASDKFESYISRVINGNENCSFGRAAEILFALNVKAEFRVVEDEPLEVTGVEFSSSDQTTGRFDFGNFSYGQEEIEWTPAEVTITHAYEGTEVYQGTADHIETNDFSRY